MSITYEPRKQFLAFHNRRQRWASLNTHRRAGKTVALVNDLMAGALECPRYKPQFAYIGPTYAQSKRIAWAYLCDYAAPWLKLPPSQSELKITLINDATISVLGADNADSHRGIYLDGAVLDEYALFRPTVFSQIIRPALSDRLGWGVFASTPRGKNLFYDIHRKGEMNPEEWYTLTLKASESGIISAQELADLTRDMDPEEAAQELECSFDAALKGAIYADQVNEMMADGRVVQEDLYDERLPTHWAYDIGMTDATVATAFQIARDGRVNIVAVESTNGATVFHHIERLHRFKGKLGTVWLPHDAKQANNQTGMSVVEQFVEQFKKLKIRGSLRGVPLHKVRDGIAAVRALFPRMAISEPMTDELVEALKAYRRQWDDTLLRFRDDPVHDWASDYADSLRYAAVAVGIMEREGGGSAPASGRLGSPFEERYDEAGKRLPAQVIVQTDTTLNDLFEQNEAKGKILRIS